MWPELVAKYTEIGKGYNLFSTGGVGGLRLRKIRVRAPGERQSAKQGRRDRKNNRSNIFFILGVEI